MRTVRVGVAGLGTVGFEAARLLLERRGEFRAKLGAEIELAAVCDRKVEAEARRLRLPRQVFRSRDPLALAEHPSLDIVVETIGGLADARALVLRSLERGKHVVTANKRLLSHHWNEIVRASERRRRHLRFEGAVAGGIPILNALHQSLAANRIQRVLGILNGTTNYLLTRMAHEGISFQDALADAQRLGLAERDPSMDLDGTDAAHKVSVIASLVASRWLPSADVSHAGIVGIETEDIVYAQRELGRAVRLLGVAAFDWKAQPAAVTGFVAPTLVPLEHPLAAVHGEYNAVIVETSAAGDLMFYGKGAGAGPAGSAVVGDVFMLAQQILSEASIASCDPLWAQGAPIRAGSIDDTSCSHYLRLEVADRPGVLARIAGTLGRSGISIAQIHQELGRGRAKVYLTTHPALHRKMRRAVSELRRLSFVSPRHGWMRML